MTQAELYTQAAALIAEDKRQFSCLAIEALGGDSRHYEALFKPDDPSASGRSFCFLLVEGLLDEGCIHSALKEWRITALLLMAAICEEEDGA